MPEGLEAARRPVGGPHEDGPLGGGQADVVQGEGHSGRRQRCAPDACPEPPDETRVVGIGRLERARRGQLRGPHGRVPAAELEEDGHEDPERDGELEQECESLLHAGKLAPSTRSIPERLSHSSRRRENRDAAAFPCAHSMAPTRGS